MAQETQMSEGRLKIKFESMDKRFTNLELALGELSEKLSKAPSVEQETVNDMQKRIDDIENLVAVEQVGVVELQKIMGSIDQKFNESKSLLSKDAQDLFQRIGSIEQKLGVLSSEKVGADLMNLEIKMEKISTELDRTLENTKDEIEKLTERTKLIDPEVITKIVKEVTELRSDLSKEIRDIKEKMNSEDSTRAEVEMKFLVSRVNSIKENVDFLINRKAEIDQKIETIEKDLSKIANTKFETLTGVNTLKENLDFLMSRKSEVDQKVDILDKKIGKFGNARFEILTKLNSLKESLDFLLKRRGEIDQKVEGMDQRIEDVQKNLLNIANSKFESLGEEFFKKLDLDKQGLIRLNSRIDHIEKELRKSLERLSSAKQQPDTFPALEFEKRVGVLEGKLNDITDKIYASKSSNLDMQIEHLLEKIVTLETRLSALEKTYFEPKRVQPIVLE